MPASELKLIQKIVAGAGLLLLAVAAWMSFVSPSVTYEWVGSESDAVTVSCHLSDGARAGIDREFRYDVTGGESYLQELRQDRAGADETVAIINEDCTRAVSNRRNVATWCLAGALALGVAALQLGAHRRSRVQEPRTESVPDDRQPDPGEWDGS